MREYLLNMRISRGMTQKEVSLKLGISESYYNLIENGNRQKDMSVYLLHGLSKVFKVSAKFLLDKELDFINRRLVHDRQSNQQIPCSVEHK